MMLLDENLFNFIHQLVGKSRLLDLIAIFFADYSGYILILIALVIIFSAKKLKDSIYNLAYISLALLLSTGIITQTIRFFFFSNRPFVDLNFVPLITKSASEASLPSGHASFFFALAFAIYYLGERRWSVIFLATSLIMGIARVYVGVHWPLDIVSGIIVAFISAYTVKLLLEPKR